MSNFARGLLILFVLFHTVSTAQVLINELHGFGGGANPPLPGDYLELWNQGSTSYDLSGHTICLWVGDAGSPNCVTIPCAPNGSHVIPAHGFWVFEEGAAALGQPLTGTLAVLNGMRGLPSVWASQGNNGCVLLDPNGVCLDYVYLRRGTTAVPGSPPNLSGGCAYALGNVSNTGSGRGHLHRLFNGDSDSFLDWDDNATSTAGTPGALNTILLASQTSVGSIGSIDVPVAFSSNRPSSHLDIDGQASSGLAPIRSEVLCAGPVAIANYRSTNIGLPFDIGVQLSPTLAANSACGPGQGGLNTLGFQTLNLNLADPTLFWTFGLSFQSGFIAPIAIPLPNSAPLFLAAQAVHLDPGTTDGFALSAPIEYTSRFDQTLVLPRTDDTPTLVDLTTLCGGVPISAFGTVYSSIWGSPNGRILFGGTSNSAFAASPNTALQEQAWAGFWTDLNGADPLSGNVSVSTALGLITVRWQDVVYFGTTATVDFQVVLDPLTDAIIFQWNTIATNPGAIGAGDAQMLGISGGSAFGATLGMSTVFTSGSTTVGALSTDLLYEFWDGFAATAPAGGQRLASFGASSGVTFLWNGLQYIAIGL